MNKEKYLFIVSCILSFWTIMHYSNIEEINISSNQYKTSNEHILQHTLYTEIPYAEILWDTSNTNPFDQMDLCC